MGETILLSKLYVEQAKEAFAKEIKVKPVEFFKEKNNQNDTSPSSEDDERALKEKVEYTEAELKSLQQQKEALLIETEKEITEAKERWNEEKQSYIEQANKEGYEAGFSQGKMESENTYKEKINEANSIIKNAQQDYHSVVEQSEQKIIDLAIHTAAKIMKQEFSDNPESFLSIVTEVIKEIKEESLVSIYLHPTNYAYVLKEKQELNEVLDGDTQVEIYIDQDIEENGCLIKHAFGEIDASISTQLDQIHHVLNDISMEHIKNEPK